MCLAGGIARCCCYSYLSFHHSLRPSMTSPLDITSRCSERFEGGVTQPQRVHLDVGAWELGATLDAPILQRGKLRHGVGKEVTFRGTPGHDGSETVSCRVYTPLASLQTLQVLREVALTFEVHVSKTEPSPSLLPESRGSF